MKKLQILISFFLIIALLSFSWILSTKNNSVTTTENDCTYEWLSGWTGKKPIYLYKRSLYRLEDDAKPGTSESYTEDTKLPLEYDVAHYDTDFMPIIAGDKILLCQTRAIKVLFNDTVFEYPCDEQIVSVTYPQEEGDTLSLYIIRFNSNKQFYKVPPAEREWLLQKITFSNGEFHAETEKKLPFPENLSIRQLNSEVQFFKHCDDCLYLILTDTNDKPSLYRLSISDELTVTDYDGSLVIPNPFDDESLWYIQKTNDGCALLKNGKTITQVSDSVFQGKFISDTIVELFFKEYPSGDWDLVNGALAPKLYAELLLFDVDSSIPACFKQEFSSPSLFHHILQRETILAIY